MSDRGQAISEKRSLRRRALKLAIVNGALWSIGNGLTSGTVIVYLALELGARGLEISLILAAPTVVGLFRLAAPRIIRRCRGVKRTCIGFSLVSYGLLLLLPLLPLPLPFRQISWNSLRTPEVSWLERLCWILLSDIDALWVLIGLLCLHQLLEYIATVALWSWLGDLVPARIRGRYFARRQVWQLAMLIPAMIVSGYCTDQWVQSHPRDDAWQAYAVAGAAGAGFLLASIVPLCFMPGSNSIGNRKSKIRNVPASAPSPGGCAAILSHEGRGKDHDVAFSCPIENPKYKIENAFWRPFLDYRFRRLLLFGCWLSFCNGLTQTAQRIYPKDVLEIGLLSMLMMQTVMRLGQAVYSPFAGSLSDRYGNRPVLLVSHVLSAGGLLFFLVATPEQPWWLLGAWLLWSAFAGLNVCLPNLMLKFSPPAAKASYVSLYFAATGVCYGVSTVAGGLLHDAVRIGPQAYDLGPLPLQMDYYQYEFTIGLILRLLGVLLLWRIIEPGAQGWRRILRGWKRAMS